MVIIETEIWCSAASAVVSQFFRAAFFAHDFYDKYSLHAGIEYIDHASASAGH